MTGCGDRQSVQTLMGVVFGALLAAFAGWSVPHYQSIQAKLYAWNAVGQDIRENEKTLSLMLPAIEASARNAGGRWTPRHLQSRGKDILSGTTVGDLSDFDLKTIDGYYDSVRSFNALLDSSQDKSLLPVAQRLPFEAAPMQEIRRDAQDRLIGALHRFRLLVLASVVFTLFFLVVSLRLSTKGRGPAVAGTCEATVS